MSLKIRLSRGGAKKRPFYRVVVADSHAPRDGRFIEKIGIFDPLKAKDAADRLVLDTEKALAWIARGAQPTDRVARLLELARRLEAPVAQQSPQGAAEEKGAGARRSRRQEHGICGGSGRTGGVSQWQRAPYRRAPSNVSSPAASARRTA